MKTDVFGQTTSLSDANALAAWNETMLAFLAHGASTPEHLAQVLNAAPGFAQAQAVKGLFYFLLGRRELMETARDALSAAKTAQRDGGANAREAHYVAALEECMAGRPSAAVHQFETVLATWPADTLAMKLSHALRFVLGDSAGMRRSVERVMEISGEDHPGHGYLLGCHAFALEETGEFERAGITGRRALWMAPDDAWGLHAVAHVHDMTANARAGLNWLEGREAAWAHCNNFRYHVWWHKALMHLDLGEVDAVLELYDSEIRKDHTDDYRDISNGTALLMRLELNGVDVGDRWEEMADFSATRTEDGSLIFADLHYLLALVATGREDAIARMLQRLHKDAATREDEIGQRMAVPGLAAARGLQAFGEGRYEEACRNLVAARPSMQLAGGSHAQRDVFERVTIDVAIRAGKLDCATSILNDRRAKRGGREDNYAAARRALIAAGSGAGIAMGHPLT